MILIVRYGDKALSFGSFANLAAAEAYAVTHFGNWATGLLEVDNWIPHPLDAYSLCVTALLPTTDPPPAAPIELPVNSQNFAFFSAWVVQVLDYLVNDSGFQRTTGQIDSLADSVNVVIADMQIAGPIA